MKSMSSSWHPLNVTLDGWVFALVFDVPYDLRTSALLDVPHKSGSAREIRVRDRGHYFMPGGDDRLDDFVHVGGGVRGGDRDPQPAGMRRNGRGDDRRDEDATVKQPAGHSESRIIVAGDHGHNGRGIVAYLEASGAQAPAQRQVVLPETLHPLRLAL